MIDAQLHGDCFDRMKFSTVTYSKENFQHIWWLGIRNRPSDNSTICNSSTQFGVLKEGAQQLDDSLKVTVFSYSNCIRSIAKLIETDNI